MYIDHQASMLGERLHQKNSVALPQVNYFINISNVGTVYLYVITDYDKV